MECRTSQVAAGISTRVCPTGRESVTFSTIGIRTRIYSDLMQHYMAGQLALMREFTVMFCPTVNSYKRTVPGTWAPTNVTWGIDNRTTALRAIAAGPKSTRVECRLSGADANPYLSLAASLILGTSRDREQFGTPRGHRQRLRIPGAGAAAESRGEH